MSLIFSAREFYCTCIDHIPKLPTLIFNNESCHKYLMKQSRTLGQTVISKEGKRFLGSWKHLITNIQLNNIRGNTIIFKMFSQGKMFSISSVPRFIETFSVLKSVQSCYKPYWTCKAGLRKDKPNSWNNELHVMLYWTWYKSYFVKAWLFNLHITDNIP